MPLRSPPQDHPLLRVLHLSRFYRRDKPALFDVTFDLHPGEFLYVAGPSGAGKSTLIRLLQRIETPDTGTIHFMDLNIAEVSDASMPFLRRKIGVVYQDFRLIEDLSLQDNVAFPLEVLGLPRTEIRRRVDEILEWVGLQGKEKDAAQGLSGGEKQRAAIARAMVHRPLLLLADEPTGNLDAVLADEMMDLFERASEENTAVILATHDRLLMASRPHPSLVLSQGRVIGLSGQAPAAAQPRAPGLEEMRAGGHEA